MLLGELRGGVSHSATSQEFRSQEGIGSLPGGTFSCSQEAEIKQHPDPVCSQGTFLPPKILKMS